MKVIGKTSVVISADPPISLKDLFSIDQPFSTIIFGNTSSTLVGDEDVGTTNSNGNINLAFIIGNVVNKQFNVDPIDSLEFAEKLHLLVLAVNPSQNVSVLIY